LNDDELRLLRVFAMKLVASFRNVLLYEQLRVYNLELQRRVEERTRALEDSNAQLHRLATTDSLTGLHNRHAIFTLAQQELTRCQRHPLPCAVALLDIDYFKRINDSWGHQVGDEVLIQFSHRLLHGVRATDAVGRVGGEEFMLVLPGADLAAATRMLERLRAEIGTVPFVTGTGPIEVTASFGVTLMRQDDPCFSQVFKRADEALYQAKGAGRDRIETR
jgi:diguanylate cyclase (GGDEF)-like protein